MPLVPFPVPPVFPHPRNSVVRQWCGQRVYLFVKARDCVAQVGYLRVRPGYRGLMPGNRLCSKCPVELMLLSPFST